MKNSSRRNAKLAAVRGWLHDRVCASEHCPAGDSDHARRTQHQPARAIVDAEGDEARRRATHDAVCIHAVRGVECYEQGLHPPDVLDRLLVELQKVIDNAVGARGVS